jgi:hypothetical protein
VDARVGAAGGRYLQRPVEQSRERPFELARDRPDLRLKLKAAKFRAVVLDDDAVGRVGDR